MKSLFVTLSFLFVYFNVLGQSDYSSGILKGLKFRKNCPSFFMGSNDHKAVYMSRNPLNYGIKHNYYLIDAKNGSYEELEHLGVRDGNLKGVSMSGIIRDDFLYEVLRFRGKGLPNKTAKIGILKRNLDDLTQIGDVKYVGECSVFEMVNVAPMINVELYNTENGFYLICDNSAIKDTNDIDPFIAFLDLKCNVVWKTDLPFLEGTEANIMDVIPDDKGDGLTIPIHIKEVTQKGGIFKEKKVETGFAILRIDSDGKMKVFNPEIPGNIEFYAQKIKFFPSKNEYVGVFYSTGKSESEPKKYLSQIEYLKWDSQGSLISNMKSFLPFDEFESDEFKNEASKVGFSLGHLVSSDGYIAPLSISRYSYQIIINNDGSFFVGTHELKATNSYLLTNSGLLMSFNDKCDLKWGRIYPGYGGADVQVLDKISPLDEPILRYSYHDGEIHMYRRRVFEPKDESKNIGKHLEHKVFSFDSGEILNTELSYNYKDGLNFTIINYHEMTVVQFRNALGSKRSFVVLD